LRESLVDGIRRGTDVMMSGKVAMVARLRRRRQGLGRLAATGGCRVMVSEVDPICALQAAMEGYEVVTMEDAAPRADIFVTATGNKDIITIEHMRAMKDRAIVCKHRSLRQRDSDRAFAQSEMEPTSSRRSTRSLRRRKRMILLSEGRLVNLGNAMGHPSFVMSASFTNQTLAQIELFRQQQGRQIREEGLCAAEVAGREGGAAAPFQDRRELTKLRPDQAE